MARRILAPRVEQGWATSDVSTSLGRYCVSTPEPGPLLSDDPIDGSYAAPDRLGRRGFAEHVVRLLDRVRLQSPSSVLGLVGDWGAGKSSVLKLIMGELRSREQGVGARDLATNSDGLGWLVADFNPWTYSDLESLQAGFFAELRSALPEADRWSETRRKIGQFGKSIAPLARLIPVVQADGAIEVASSLIAGDESAAATRLAAERALAEFDRPILMVMDDLDRLTPNELLLVFKLVRLVGRLPNVYYLLAYDEGTLLDVLARTDLVGKRDSRARDYLEKIIQIRIDLPPLREAQAATMIDGALAGILRRNDLPLEAISRDRFATAYHDHLRHRLDTPRTINRYFAQVEAHYPLLVNEVDFTDFLLLAWIRTAEPAVYRLVQRHRDELTRSQNWIFSPAGREESHAQALERWTSLLLNALVPPQHVDGVLAVLSQMFLPIRSAREGMDYASSSFMRELQLRRGVGHADYFDRYFSSGIPDEDIPDSVVRSALEDLGNGLVHSPDVGRLVTGLIVNTARLCRKIRAEIEGIESAIPNLLVFLAHHYEELPVTHALLDDPRGSVEFLVADLLPSVPADQGPTVLRRMGQTTWGASLAGAVVAKARHGSSTPDGRRAIDWLDDAVETSKDLIESVLDALAASPIEGLDQALWGRLVWAWFRIDSDGTRNWLRGATRTKPGWTVSDILAALVDPGHMDFGPFAPLDLESVDNLLGVEFVLEEYGQQLDGVEESAPRGLDPTWGNRVRVALSVLRREQLRRASLPKAPESSEGATLPEGL